ncbi:MAG: glucose-1-phosphate thymidylyltransferase [Candidatus Daviesbacteria bacterium]|nr:glucose-1-phosphate thymidylyltransferase [Candidatus Daviesbacteria bacterium]
MKAIIPTGGRGTRMRPLTFSANKHFIPLANKPLIFYPIETIAAAGIKDIALTYNPGGLDEIRETLGDGSRWGVKFTYVLQEEPKGLANIFQVCEEFVGDDLFVMHLGDNIFIDGIKDLVEHFEKEKPDGLVAMVHHKENTRLGVPYFDDQGRLVKYVEKPENPPHDFAIPGIYFFSPEVFECFKGSGAIKPSPRGEYEISAPYQWLIDNGKRVDVVEYKGVWLDPGKFDDWLEANKYILDNKLEEKRESEADTGTVIEGKVSIGKNCRISNSKIIGPVIIGDNVEVENAKINSHASISDNCVIRNSEVGNSVFLSGVRLENVKRLIEGSLVGKDTEIVSSGEDSIKLFVGELCKVEV